MLSITVALIMLIGQIASQTIGFIVVLDKDQIIPEDQILQYDKVITNHGNAYNQQDGVFTAPKKGLYVFSINAVTIEDQEFLIDLYHNDKYIVSAYGTGKSSDFGSGSNTVVLKLDKNDQVYVKTPQQVHLFGRPDEIYATFAGFLVSQKDDDLMGLIRTSTSGFRDMENFRGQGRISSSQMRDRENVRKKDEFLPSQMRDKRELEGARSIFTFTNERQRELVGARSIFTFTNERQRELEGTRPNIN